MTNQLLHFSHSHHHPSPHVEGCGHSRPRPVNHATSTTRHQLHTTSTPAMLTTHHTPHRLHATSTTRHVDYAPRRLRATSTMRHVNYAPRQLRVMSTTLCQQRHILRRHPPRHVDFDHDTSTPPRQPPPCQLHHIDVRHIPQQRRDVRRGGRGGGRMGTRGQDDVGHVDGRHVSIQLDVAAH